jgi:hypothetical protein
LCICFFTLSFSQAEAAQQLRENVKEFEKRAMAAASKVGAA